MALRIKPDGTLSGQKASFSRYEKEIISGERDCPFTVEFRDTKYAPVIIHMGRFKYPVESLGEVVCTSPIPLTPNGKPKTNLFQ